MRPIFKEERELLFDNFGLSVPEHCWYDRGWITQFDEHMNKNHIGRLITKSPIDVTIIISKSKKNIKFTTPITHETYLSLVSNYREKMDSAIIQTKKALNDLPQSDRISLSHSTGKDSIVAQFVLDKVLDDYTILFNNTSIESGGTIKIAKKLPNVKLLNPQKGFYTWVKESPNRIPRRTSRRCCTIYKEGQIAKNTNKFLPYIFVTGLRRSESTARKDYKFLDKNKNWHKKEMENWHQLNIIIDWTDIDVWACILLEGLDFNPLYRYGYNRVGCIVACPMQGDYFSVLDRILFPHLYNKWNTILRDDFIEIDGWTIYNCTIDEYLWRAWTELKRVREVPTDEVIDEFMKFKGLDDKNIAMKYFDKTCVNGCISIRGKKNKPRQLKSWEIGMNLKMYGRGISPEKMLCAECMAIDLNISVEDIKEKSKDFKEQGCELF